MPDLAIVAVSIDQDDLPYRQFLDKRHIDLITVRDPSQRINTMYGTAQIPETYIIDRKGMLRRKLVNSQAWTNPELMKFLSDL
jgi:cytochrome c biogenesis protein CcmG, thiol:disulfide interchange protein DsbE